MAPTIVVLDNYDSFVYNLVQYLGQLGAAPVVYRNDSVRVAEVEELAPAGILVSPGPGRPEDAGMSVPLIEAFAGRCPLLGVCLGHQSIGYAFGARVLGAPELLHGKTSSVFHDGKGIFAGLPTPFTATRYHSLMVERETVSPDLIVSAWTEDGTVMGLRHRSLPIEGVQFHPEAVLTEGGHLLLANWLSLCGFPEALDLVGSASPPSLGRPQPTASHSA